MRRFVLALLAAISAGCTTTQQANEALATKFTGQTADNFFLQYGPPVSSYEMTDGRRIFVWSERAKNFSTPGYSSSTVNLVGNTAFVNTTTTPGTDYQVQCQVRLVVSKSGVIEEILAHSDSIGVWQLSRCNEVFGRKVNGNSKASST